MSAIIQTACKIITYIGFNRSNRRGHACKLLYFSTKEVRYFLPKDGNVLLFYLKNIVACKDDNWSDSNSLLQSPDQCIPIFDYHSSIVLSFVHYFLFILQRTIHSMSHRTVFFSASTITLTPNDQHLEHPCQLKPDPRTYLLMH